jgi:hypothetical protein
MAANSVIQRRRRRRRRRRWRKRTQTPRRNRKNQLPDPKMRIYFRSTYAVVKRYRYEEGVLNFVVNFSGKLENLRGNFR